MHAPNTTTVRDTEAGHVTIAADREADAVYDIITRAFAADPMARWTWPDDAQFAQVFPQFARAFGGAAFERGSAWRIGTRAAALWLPPDAAPDDEQLTRIIEHSVAAHRRGAIFAMFEQMAAVHPHDPVCHLPLIGVDPAHQGEGLGSALLRHGLARCDREGIPAYLEATSPRSAALYERHGFQPTGHITSADSPPLVPMLRPPRAS